MNVVIDWGNTRLKAGWFEGDTLVETGRYVTVEALLTDLVQRLPVHSIVSSTSRPADDLRADLASLGRDFLVLDGYTSVPIQKAYDTPYTLGADRVAAAVGATALFPGEDCLVMDLGTCLTADFVSRDGAFEGGLISPGVRMRLRAMHEQTARLPLVDLPYDLPESEWPGVITKNTRQGLLSGVLNGLAFEMNGIITQYRRERPGVVVLLCGGDASTFESRLKPPIFAVSELVLIGLNRILQYNVKNLQADTPDVNA